MNRTCQAPSAAPSRAVVIPAVMKQMIGVRSAPVGVRCT